MLTFSLYLFFIIIHDLFAVLNITKWLGHFWWYQNVQISLGSVYDSYEFFVKTLAREYPLSFPRIQVISYSTCAQVMLLSLFRFHVSLVSKTNKNQIKIYAIPFIFYFYKISTSKSYWITLNFTHKYNVCLVRWFTILLYGLKIDILNILSYAHHENKFFYLIV